MIAAAAEREFHEQQIVFCVWRGGQDWAANSPDMSPMDFFLWPYMKVNLTYGQSGVSVMSHQTKDDMVTF